MLRHVDRLKSVTATQTRDDNGHDVIDATVSAVHGRLSQVVHTKDMYRWLFWSWLSA